MDEQNENQLIDNTQDSDKLKSSLYNSGLNANNNKEEVNSVNDTLVQPDVINNVESTNKNVSSVDLYNDSVLKDIQVNKPSDVAYSIKKMFEYAKDDPKSFSELINSPELLNKLANSIGVNGGGYEMYSIVNSLASVDYRFKDELIFSDKKSTFNNAMKNIALARDSIYSILGASDKESRRNVLLGMGITSAALSLIPPIAPFNMVLGGVTVLLTISEMFGGAIDLLGENKSKFIENTYSSDIGFKSAIGLIFGTYGFQRSMKLLPSAVDYLNKMNVSNKAKAFGVGAGLGLAEWINNNQEQPQPYSTNTPVNEQQSSTPPQRSAPQENNTLQQPVVQPNQDVVQPSTRIEVSNVEKQSNETSKPQIKPKGAIAEFHEGVINTGIDTEGLYRSGRFILPRHKGVTDLNNLWKDISSSIGADNNFTSQQISPRSQMEEVKVDSGNTVNTSKPNVEVPIKESKPVVESIETDAKKTNLKEDEVEVKTPVEKNEVSEKVIKQKDLYPNLRDKDPLMFKLENIIYDYLKAKPNVHLKPSVNEGLSIHFLLQDFLFDGGDLNYSKLMNYQLNNTNRVGLSLLPSKNSLNYDKMNIIEENEKGRYILNNKVTHTPLVLSQHDDEKELINSITKNKQFKLFMEDAIENNLDEMFNDMRIEAESEVTNKRKKDESAQEYFTSRVLHNKSKNEGFTFASQKDIKDRNINDLPRKQESYIKANTQLAKAIGFDEVYSPFLIDGVTSAIGLASTTFEEFMARLMLHKLSGNVNYERSYGNRSNPSNIDSILSVNESDNSINMRSSSGNLSAGNISGISTYISVKSDLIFLIDIMNKLPSTSFKFKRI